MALIPGGKKFDYSRFDSRSLAAGIKVELEHTSRPDIAKEIAAAHLTEDPRYYTKLARMESGVCGNPRYTRKNPVAMSWTINELGNLPVGTIVETDYLNENELIEDALRKANWGGLRFQRTVQSAGTAGRTVWKTIVPPALKNVIKPEYISSVELMELAEETRHAFRVISSPKLNPRPNRNPPRKKWLGEVPGCDICGKTPFDMLQEDVFYDAKTTEGPWANMCHACFSTYGTGLGTGRGQIYSTKTKEKLESHPRFNPGARKNPYLKVQDLPTDGVVGKVRSFLLAQNIRDVEVQFQSQLSHLGSTGGRRGADVILWDSEGNKTGWQGKYTGASMFESDYAARAVDGQVETELPPGAAALEIILGYSSGRHTRRARLYLHPSMQRPLLPAAPAENLDRLVLVLSAIAGFKAFARPEYLAKINATSEELAEIVRRGWIKPHKGKMPVRLPGGGYDLAGSAVTNEGKNALEPYGSYAVYEKLATKFRLARENPSTCDSEIEIAYMRFHGVPPDSVTEHPRAWVPGELVLIGHGVDVGYGITEARSEKDGYFVHDFSSGVKIYRRAKSNEQPDKVWQDWPSEMWVLGKNLGFTVEDASRKKHEVPASRKKLVTNAAGDMLAVVDTNGDVEYVLKGGAMGVSDWIRD